MVGSKVTICCRTQKVGPFQSPRASCIRRCAITGVTHGRHCYRMPEPPAAEQLQTWTYCPGTPAAPFLA
eukprot:18576-Eustigmatos_ZCMA.PRE.1